MVDAIAGLLPQHNEELAAELKYCFTQAKFDQVQLAVDDGQQLS